MEKVIRDNNCELWQYKQDYEGDAVKATLAAMKLFTGTCTFHLHDINY